MSTFLLEIITPTRVAFSDQASQLTAPTADGVIGVLPHHMRLFTRLIEGELVVNRHGQDLYVAVGGGFMEVTEDRVSVLVTRAVDADELNEAEIKKAIAQAREVIAKKPHQSELVEAQAQLRRATIDLQVLKRRRSPVRTS